MKTFDEALGIEFGKRGNKIDADAKRLTGSPPIGKGRSKWEAKCQLLESLLWGMALHGWYRDAVFGLLEEAADE